MIQAQNCSLPDDYVVGPPRTYTATHIVCLCYTQLWSFGNSTNIMGIGVYEKRSRETCPPFNENCSPPYAAIIPDGRPVFLCVYIPRHPEAVLHALMHLNLHTLHTLFPTLSSKANSTTLHHLHHTDHKCYRPSNPIQRTHRRSSARNVADRAEADTITQEYRQRNESAEPV